MGSIEELFGAMSRAQQSGVEGYFVENKYFDARRSREQKQLGLSGSGSLTSRAASKKTTYLDDILKGQSKLPGPSTYNPH